MLLRQGDVLLRKIDDMPTGAREAEEPVEGRFILAEGEATGHAHAIKAAVGIMLWKYAAARVLEVAKETQLEHEEHEAITLPPGQYEVVRQREYIAGSERWVMD